MDASPIAIVGVSCRFASAPDPGAFWRMIMHRASGIAPFGEELSLPYGGRNLFDPRTARCSVRSTPSSRASRTSRAS